MSLIYTTSEWVNGIAAALKASVSENSRTEGEFSSLMEHFVGNTEDGRGSAPEVLELLALFGEIGRMEGTNG